MTRFSLGNERFFEISEVGVKRVNCNNNNNNNNNNLGWARIEANKSHREKRKAESGRFCLHPFSTKFHFFLLGLTVMFFLLFFFLVIYAKKQRTKFVGIVVRWLIKEHAIQNFF